MDLLSNPYRRRWLGWGAIAVAFFLVSLHRSSTAVLSEELMRAFDTSGAQLGLLHSSFFYLYAAFQVPAGLLTDSFGARFVSAAGAGLMSIGALVFGLSESYALAFLGRVLVGLGASVLFVSILRFCANWFRPDEFGTMTGVTFTVAQLGALAATTPLAVAIATVGWRSTLVGLAAIGFAAAVAIVLVSHDTPAQADVGSIENVPERPTMTASALKDHTLRAFRESETWLLGIVLFLMTGTGITIFGLWGIPYLVHSYGISVTEASVYLLVGNVGALIGPTAFGWFSDRIGRRTELIVLSAAAFGLMWGIFSVFGAIPLSLVAAVFLFARFLQGGVPLAFTVMKERHPEGVSGTVIGIVNSMGWFGAAVFPVLLGAVLDAFWTGETVGGARVYTAFGYRVMFAIALGAGLVAALCALVLHYRIRGEDAPKVSETEAETPSS